MRANEFSLLTESKTYKLWESAGQRLSEAQLTQDQITQIFQQVEQGATAAGGNRTMIGQGKDAASAINTAWENLKSKASNSGPVKNVDSMYDQAAEKLKQATGGDQGVMKYVQKYRDFAKAHPIAQSLIYSALIAAAGISGAGIGGAAALGLFKMVDKLLQGEKFSSAAYQGAKTGGMAYAAGQIGQAMKGQPQGQGETNISSSSDSTEFSTQATGKIGDYGQPTYNITPNYNNSSTLSGVSGSQITSNPAYQDVIQKFGDNPGTRRAAMAAAKAAIARGTNESVSLSESQIYLVIGNIVNRQRKLDEGIMDTVKGAAGKAMNWAQTKGKNLTTKVTADKLLQAWKKAGSPTDSLDVASIIQRSGVPADTIKQVYSGMKIPFAGQPGGGAAGQRNIPVQRQPAAQEPAAQEPAAQEPAAQEPATDAPVAASGQTPPAAKSPSSILDRFSTQGKISRRTDQIFMDKFLKDLKSAEQTTVGLRGQKFDTNVYVAKYLAQNKWNPGSYKAELDKAIASDFKPQIAKVMAAIGKANNIDVGAGAASGAAEQVPPSAEQGQPSTAQAKTAAVPNTMANAPVSRTNVAPASAPGAGAFGQMASQLTKPGSVASGVKKKPTSAPGAGAFGQMAGQMTGQPAKQAVTKPTKISPPRASGAPTPEEEAKLQQRIQQQLQRQGKA